MTRNTKTTALFLKFQQEEVDGAALYEKIAKYVKDEKNRGILQSMARSEARHAEIMRRYTGETLKPNTVRVFFYAVMTLLFGYTFSIRFLERGEVDIRDRYNELIASSPEAVDLAEIKKVIRDEEGHETAIINMLREERVDYVGSTVLGMNDALVELTGALAGYTFAMQDTRMISMAGIITGFSATLSMAASEYLSARADGGRNAIKSCVYTGIAYLVTVILLILPYLLLPTQSYMTALLCTLATAIVVIAAFNWYMSVVLDRSFKRGFLVMAGVSVSVAVLSFFIGIVVKNVLGIEI